MPQRLKIAMIASECVPYVKTGGLADVVGALPKALRALGHSVIVIIPKYSAIDAYQHRLRPFLSPMGVWMGTGQEWCAVQFADNDGVPVYFIESEKYFGRWGLYHDLDNNEYLDNARRFGFLTRAGLQLCKDINFVPDVIHVHDWHTAVGSAYLKIWDWNDPILGKAASLLTIHNLAYQGVYPASDLDYLGLQWSNFVPGKFEDHGKINLLKGGIVYSDVVNTVSPTYADDSRTPEGGYGLAPFLAAKGENYLGILNGVDYDVWNPETDAYLPATYSIADLSGKAACKRALQERLNLEVNENIPVIGVISRFTEQKGLDLLAEVIEGIILSMKVQFAILGAGDKHLEWMFGNLPAHHSGKIGSYIGYDEGLAHLIEAGSDFFIMPSRFEPCGLNQIYSLKYGTLPIVRATGGLQDTVEQYNEATGDGTGFKFMAPNSNAIYYTVGWAVSTYYDRPQHMEKMIHKAMSEDFSWDIAAGKYVETYGMAMRNRGSR